MAAKKVWKILSNLITGLLCVLFIFMAIIVISSKASGGEPSFLGFQLKTVLSGSMEPTFKTGSIIAIQPVQNKTNLLKDDIITFSESQDKLITHRIIEVVKNGDQVMYKTKGDNNEDPDTNLVISQNVVGKYTGFTIPYLGYFIDFAKSKNGSALLLILPGLLLLIYSAVSIFNALREIDKSNKASEKTV